MLLQVPQQYHGFGVDKRSGQDDWADHTVHAAVACACVRTFDSCCTRSIQLVVLIRYCRCSSSRESNRGSSVQYSMNVHVLHILVIIGVVVVHVQWE